MSPVRDGRPCDFCYQPQPQWDGGFQPTVTSQFRWEIKICDSCRLLLRNVIGVALHRLTHSQIVEAISAKMEELGLSYDDLMKPADFEPQKELEPVEYSALDRSTDNYYGMGQ